MENFPNPTLLIVVLGIASMAPFIAVMVSSYVKIVVVVYLVRNALGIQQIPPNLAVNGLAIILSLYIMAPIGTSMYETLATQSVDLSSIKDPAELAVFSESIEPLREFLISHTQEGERQFFHDTTAKIWPKEQAATVTKDDFLILLPSFTMSQLTSAFQIGFLVYLPFIAIDLIVSNILLSMGMMMVSPMTISLPFKLLLFVMVDGWTRLIHGLVLTY